MKLEFKKDIFPFKRDFEIWIDSLKVRTIKSGETIELQLSNEDKNIKPINKDTEFVSSELDIENTNKLSIVSYLRSPLTILILLLMIATIYLKNFKGLEQGNLIMIGLILYPAYFNTIGKKHYYRLQKTTANKK